MALIGTACIMRLKTTPHGAALPRRYRPPTRRRKTKKQRLPEGTEPPSHSDAAASAPPSPPVPPPVAVERERPTEGQHVARDHSYVLGDLRRIGLIVTFITIGLVITAILR